MWTQVLAGEKGDGRDFNMVYFAGPTDFAAYFGVHNSPVLDTVEKYIDVRAQSDDAFRRQVAADPQARKAFLRYYALRASVAYSKGCHDEWNIFRLVNQNIRSDPERSVGEQITMYFDGRALSPAEMETEITPGYQRRSRPVQRDGVNNGR
jgi:hypothetical protein